MRPPAVTVVASQSPEVGAVEFRLNAVPPALTSGTGRATLSSQGLVLEVAVRGPAEEITRANAFQQANLIWHLGSGTCAAWQRSDPTVKVVARWSLPPQVSDRQEFRYEVRRGELDDMAQPHAVLAFRNGGGGPPYTCGDIPPLRISGLRISGLA